MRPSLPRLAAAGLTIVVAACGGKPRPHTPAAVPVAARPAPAISRAVQPSIDPIATLIATSEKHFADGERELSLGHLERARTEFDLAIDVLLQSPAGARSDARLREHFDRLVDRISAREVATLAQGDGFTEKKYEPA